LTGAWACWQRRRDVAGGVMIGAAAIFKLFPAALFPYLIWRRHWKLLAAAVVTVVGGLALGLAVTSLDHNIYFFRDMLPHLAAGTGYRENQSLAGVATRLCDPNTANARGSAGWCGRLIDWPAILVVLAIVARNTSRLELPRANPGGAGPLVLFPGGARHSLSADRLPPPPLDRLLRSDPA